MAGFCLSSYMLLVIPVVAMLMGRGLRVGVDRSLTPPLATEDDSALPGLPAPALAVLFSREMPRIERGKVSRGMKQHTVTNKIGPPTLRRIFIFVKLFSNNTKFPRKYVEHFLNMCRK